MFPPEYFPIVNHGMSVFTAGIFFFIGVSSVFMYNLFKRELHRINNKIESQSKVTDGKIKDTNEKVDLLFTKIDNSNSDIADIKSNIATITEAILWIKQYSYKGHK